MQTLLIANRGEIACRIIRAAKEMGIGAVAVASAADRGARHTRLADRTVEIGGAPARESYLDVAKIIAAAKEAGADAVHPGYGFLAQSPEAAREIAASGLRWVGPPSSAIRLMGDKTAARRAMRAAGVPIVPGYEPAQDEAPADDATLLREAARIGLPLMVKAAAGGGGRGMRVVREAAGVPEALESARREAEKAFGDGRLFLERFVEDARHVEIQVLADTRGACVSLLERECSVQRRHQKLIEEAPSPLMTPALRRAMGDAAVAAARACGYESAGTVEFLVAKGRPGEPAIDGWSFFFLEMNTRVQVEHPVTELTTGVDIVQAQLRIARGEPLGIDPASVAHRGHAIECRLNAEDAPAGFAPASGPLHLARWPKGPGVRVDLGYESGDEVPMHYDSLMAKVLVHAETRERAIARMRGALERTCVLGVPTTREVLLDVLAHPRFVEGSVTTAFLDREYQGWRPKVPGPGEAALIAVALEEMLAREDGTGSGSGTTGSASLGDRWSPWARADGYRPAGR